MRALLKKYFGPIYIALITAVVAGILLCNNEMGMIFDALGALNVRWVWAAGGCIVVYLFLRMAQMRYYLARRGQRIGWLQAAEVTGAGQFYSAITPSSSGGQPMQVLHLRRMGVPVSLGTACASVKFLGFQTAFLALGGVMAVARWEMLSHQLYGLRWLVALGYVVNAALIVAVVLTIPKSRAVDALIRLVIRLGERLRLVKNGEAAFERFQDSLKDYRDALVQLMKAPMDALIVFGLSLLQVVAYMFVAVCMYRAFGLTGMPDGDILALQLMLFIAAAFVPLPGAAGAQESGFCAFFAGIFPGDSLIAAMVCWRFFSYYLLLVLGLAMMLPVRFRGRKRNSAEK